MPAVIRKDMWRPLLTVHFPSEAQGLAALRKLREYRKLHELSWSQADRTRVRREETVAAKKEFEELGAKIQKKTRARQAKRERGRLIMDQKANAIADLAAVLKEQDVLANTPETVARKQKMEEEAANPKATPETTQASRPKHGPLPKRGPLRKQAAAENIPIYTLDGVRIRWANPLDAEYAESWPAAVQHDIVGITRYTAPKPDAEPIVQVNFVSRVLERIPRHWGRKGEQLVEHDATPQDGAQDVPVELLSQEAAAVDQRPRL